jgi:hypothetical protein
MGITTEDPTRDAFVCETLRNENILVLRIKRVPQSLRITIGESRYLSTGHQLLRDLLGAFICVLPIQGLWHNMIQCHIHI